MPHRDPLSFCASGSSVSPRPRPRARVLTRAAVACIGAALALGGCSSPSADTERPKHVIVISMDTARADHFGFLGSVNVRTPGLDALAAEGIVFTDYMTVVPTTLASHTTLFTGKYPHHHGTAGNGFVVNEQNEMLAETLQEAGFHTAGFAGSFALDKRFNFAQGFDHYDQEFDVLIGEMHIDQNQRLAEQVTDAAIAYLEEAGIPDRLFLFAHYFDPHAPYQAPPPFDAMYDPAGTRDLRQIPVIKRISYAGPEQMHGDIRRLAMQYASEISYSDEHVARLLDWLRQQGILDHALVVFTTDHGECLWEHGEEFDHGKTVYDATMRAACVMRLPGGELGGTRVDGLVANIDVLPTVLDLLGLAVPPGVDGEAIPLRSAAGGIGDRTRYGEAAKPSAPDETNPSWANIRKSRCVREGRYKLIMTPYLGTEELYDVLADPHELVNLLESPSQDIERLASDMRSKLLTWTNSAQPLLSEFDATQTEETIEKLRSLGYLN